MSNWIWRGLRGGILATRYPLGPAEMPARYRGAARSIKRAPADAAARGSHACLSGAIAEDGSVTMSRCFQCGQCARVAPEAFAMSDEFELACIDGDAEEVRARLRARVAALGRSIHVRHVDAGSDGSCEQELQAVFNPFYDLNRLGVFLTATPRHADLLLVTGVVTRPMVAPLRAAYDAIPEPRIVVAVGSAAASGSLFRNSDVVAGPVDRVLPVDVKVPGAPPAPLSIIHGIWVALGRIAARARAEAS